MELFSTSEDYTLAGLFDGNGHTIWHGAEASTGDWLKVTFNFEGTQTINLDQTINLLV